MFTGQVAVITNTQDWLSDVRELIDDRDGSTIDLTTPGYIVDIVVTIRGLSSSSYRDYGSIPASPALVTASIANGKVSIVGPGYLWLLVAADLSGLCAGTYRLGVKITLNGFVQDVIDGSIVVVEGN